MEKAKCAAYEGCVNGLQKLIPGSNGTRIMQGGGLVLGGIFKGLGGVMLSAASATFSWTGIAVPGIGAGVVTASAGASDIYQGIEEISLGVKGDSETKTSNGLSDMLYGGNDGIYHASTGIAAISGSLLIPYVKTAYSKTPVVTGEGAAGQTGGAEEGSKTINDIIDSLPETTNGKGVARNFESTGGFDQTIRDFESLNPIDVREIQTQYGLGKVGKLSDGTTVVARPGSTTGGATLEIRISNSKVYKIRY